MNANDRESLKPSQNDKLRINLGLLAEVNTEKMRDTTEKTLAPISVKIPERKAEKLKLMLLAKIKVFDSVRLDEYEFSITCPKILDAVGDNEKQLAFICDSGSNPGFRYQYV